MQGLLCKKYTWRSQLLKSADFREMVFSLAPKCEKNTMQIPECLPDSGICLYSKLTLRLEPGRCPMPFSHVIAATASNSSVFSHVSSFLISFSSLTSLIQKSLSKKSISLSKLYSYNRLQYSTNKPYAVLGGQSPLFLLILLSIQALLRQT